MRIASIQNGPLSSLERAAIIEEFWASRNAWADSMNAERRLIWEGKWAGIGEQDLALSHTRRIEAGRPEEHIPSRILVMRRREENPEESADREQAPSQRLNWQPSPLSVPAPGSAYPAAPHSTIAEPAFPMGNPPSSLRFSAS